MTQRHRAQLALIIVAAGLIPGAALAASGHPLDQVQVVGDLWSGPVGSAGHVGLEVERALFTDRIGPARAVPGSFFVVLQMAVTNLSPEPFVPGEKISVRLENGPQSIPGWELDDEASSLLVTGHSDAWEADLPRGQTAVLFCAYSVPGNAKDLWVHLISKVSASPEKGVSGGIRCKLGDLPGDEPVVARTAEYIVVIGSFWSKSGALRYAAHARRGGFSAWVAEAGRPEGMYVVAVWRARELFSARNFAEVAKQQGYRHAYVLPPWRPGAR